MRKNKEKANNSTKRHNILDQEPNEEQPDDLSNYSLTRDRWRREVRLPVRYAHANCISYALNLVGELSESRQ